MISHSRFFFVVNTICEKILKCERDIENPPIKLLENFWRSSPNPITVLKKRNLIYIFEFVESYLCFQKK